jgi:simple sugar transport system ATP-binding protein
MNAQQLRKRHLAHIPEDRMVDGVAEDASIEDNLIVDRFDRKQLSSKVLLHYKAVTAYSDDLIHRFEILAPSSKATVKSLSGGNMQKVVVARELSGNPSLIIADQPSRGVDVGSTEMIHNLLVKARDEGCAILLVSADLDEVLKLSTRVLVMYSGEIVAEFDDVANRTPEEFGPYMLGLQRNEVSA